MRSRKILLSLFTSVQLLAVSALFPCLAFGMTQDDVCTEFSSGELSYLFVETDYDSCEFVMHDYDTDSNTYLSVRADYEDRYYDFVGSDSVDILSSGGVSAIATQSDALSVISDTQQAPWFDLLNTSDLYGHQGSVFMVSSNIALTAAHCVYQNGEFYPSYEVQSGHTEDGISWPWKFASKTIVQKAWVENSEEGTEEWQHDFGHDFAVLVFDEPPEGTAGTYFSLETISIADSLSLSINNAGYAECEGYSGVRVWTNSESGTISPVDLFFPGGNCFQMSIDEIEGMSGGPVFCADGDVYTAVGLNSYSVSFLNYACRITERLQVLVAWAKEGGYENTASGSSGGGSSNSGAEEPAGTIGIFAPSDLWVRSHDE